MADRAILEKRAIDAYRASHAVAFAPDLTHRCTNACAFWEDRATGCYVCKTSLAVHACGEMCQSYMVTEEFEVCYLTGRVVGNTPAVHHWLKKGPRVVQDHSMPKVGPTVDQLKTQRCRVAAERAVVDLFTGKERQAIAKRGRAKLASAAKSAKRPLCLCGAGSLHATVAKLAVALAKDKKLLVTTDSKTVAALAATIGAYVAKYVKHLKTTAAAAALAAAVIDRMVVGHVVKGSVMIPKIDFVARYAPHPLDHATILNLRCRAVSAANRLLADKVVSAAGGPLSHMALEL